LHHVCAKSLVDRGKRWLAWLDDLTGNHISIDDIHTSVGKGVGNGGFSAADATGQRNSIAHKPLLSWL
jgi:hypothetical protein